MGCGEWGETGRAWSPTSVMTRRIDRRRKLGENAARKSMNDVPSRESKCIMIESTEATRCNVRNEAYRGVPRWKEAYVTHRGDADATAVYVTYAAGVTCVTCV